MAVSLSPAEELEIVQRLAHDRTLARAVDGSGNAKIGKCAVTYCTQASCPRHCRFLRNGCMAEHGRILMNVTRFLAPWNADVTPEAVAEVEAEAIGHLSGLFPLRLHVVGDCVTNAATRIVAEACWQYYLRSAQPVWGYTHAWREVDPLIWYDQGVRMLASCETPEEVHQAQSMGWATAMVVEAFTSPRRYDHRGVSLLPCPEETGQTSVRRGGKFKGQRRKIRCTDCRLCWDTDRLRRENLTIGFAAHSQAKSKVCQALQKANSPDSNGGAENSNGDSTVWLRFVAS